MVGVPSYLKNSPVDAFAPLAEREWSPPGEETTLGTVPASNIVEFQSAFGTRHHLKVEAYGQEYSFYYVSVPGVASRGP